MLLGEPEPTQADLHFRLFGFPVRVHPFFWVVAVVLGFRASDDARTLVTWIVAVFVGVLVHELGHAVVMRWNGFYPHITLYALGGLASYGSSPYGAASVGPWRQIGISLAGPAAGFLLAAAVCAGLVASGMGVNVSSGELLRVMPVFGVHPDLGVYLGLPLGIDVLLGGEMGAPLLMLFIAFLLLVTIAYGILNLMPIYPLDGGQVARELFLMAMPREGIRHSLILSMIAAGAVAVLGIMQGSILLGIMFGFLAFSSYNALQRYLGRGPW